MKRKIKRDEVILIRSDSSLVARLKLAAELTDTNMSHLTREAIREKLNRLATKFPQLSKAA